MNSQRLAIDLPDAVLDGQIRAVFQPQIDMLTGEIVSVEALARWQHPEFGLISPLDFIPIAESTALIHSLGRVMIDQALECLVTLRSEGIDVEVSVNVSAAQLESLAFYDNLDSDIEHHELARGSLTIEITESQPILEVPSIVHRLWQLRRAGLGIAIDDYGTGHSSLQQLDRIPATELKIDQSLVRDTSREATRLIRAVIELAHFRSMRVVAEGIETESQLERMRDLGADRAQGFLLARPLSRADLETSLRG